MVKFSAVILSFLLVISMAASWAQTASPPAAPPQGVITGTVTYNQRMALPRDAAIQVKLVDTSAGSSPTATVAQTIFAAAGQQAPIGFKLTYNPADINQAHTYQLQANITINGKPGFATTTAYPVLTQGAPSQVHMVLEAAKASAQPEAGRKLRDTHWRLVELNGKPAIAGTQGYEPYLILYKNSQISGYTGCNRITGTYIAAVGGLQFTPASSTMMACPPPQAGEDQAVFAALKATRFYRIEGDTLELMNNGQQVLAKLEAKAKNK